MFNYHKLQRQSMRPRRNTVMACIAAIGLVSLACLSTPNRAEAAGYTVSGNHILDPNGAVYQIHGAARSGFETSAFGDGHFTQTDFNNIAAWHGANTVRIAFNESYMLSDSSCYDANYLGRLDAAATAANNAGLNVIFDLHWNTVNTTGCATSQQEMADRRSLTAWQIMANRYKTWPKVFFELYNEPNTISWAVWKNGDGTWAGMQEMYNTVRNNGFNNLVIIGGLNWAFDLSGVPANRIAGVNIVYATHPYDFSGKQLADYKNAFGNLTATDPVVATEFGNFNCTTGYITSALNYFDAPEGDSNRRMSWTGWAWNSPASCGFPSIINDWNGTPSVMGQPEHDRLATYGGGGGGIPPAPTGLTATAGNAQVSLSWNASTGATAYDVKRSTVSGSGYATVSSPTTTSYTNTGLTNGTTYFFVVDAKNASGTSGNSNQASATPTSGGSSGVVSINSGGPAVSPFVADVDFSGGTAATNWTGTIDTSGASNPAPQAVYQSERYGANTYTIGGLTANGSYTVRLHFCENFFTVSGARVFNVSINSVSKLTNFDIFATTGAIHKANTQSFAVTADGTGKIAVAYTNVTNNALSNGVEVLTSGGSAPPAPTGLAATAGNAQVALTWNASTGATAYDVKRSTVSGSGYVTVSSPATTSYTNTGLTNGTTYFFVVDAKNANGTSGNSNQASAMPTAGGGGNTHGGTWSGKAVLTTTAGFTNMFQVANCAANSTYVGSIWLKGSGSLELAVKAGNWGADIKTMQCNATSTWTQYTLPSFSTGSNTQLTFVLQDQYGGTAGTVYIDDGFLGVANGTNILANAGFESGATNWSTGTAFSIGQF